MIGTQNSVKNGGSRAAVRAAGLLLGVGLVAVTASGIAAPRTAALTQLVPIDRLQPAVSDAPGEQIGRAKGANPPLFSDGFEARPSEQPLQGKLRLSPQSYEAPAPDGTSLQSASVEIRDATGLSFLQSDTGMLARVSPNPRVFESRVDFERLTYSPSGTVEAPIRPVDLSLTDPASSTSGCEASDFNGFPAGHIALIQRGTCSFSLKASNAEAAGAVGVIIMNQGTADRTGIFVGTLTEEHRGNAPVVFTTFDLGQQWASQSGAVFRFTVDTGQPSSAWELVPVARPNASEGVHWIRNSVTGELLATRPTRPYGSLLVNAVVLDRADPDDQQAWWRVQGGNNVELINVATNGALALVPFEGDVYLVSGLRTNLNLYCANAGSCYNWEASQRLLPSTGGSTRLRSALGEYYLHLEDAIPQVRRVKDGWPKAQWVLEVVPNTAFRRLLNLQTGEYLHVQNGGLEAGSVEPGWWSAMWVLESASTITETNLPGSFDTEPLASPITNATGYFHLRNRWTGQRLSVLDGDAVTANTADGALRSLWVLDDAVIPEITDANLRTRVKAALGIGASAPIRASEAAGLYQLSAADAGIGNLSGLGPFINLNELRLPGNAITNVAPLAPLTQLSFLDLSRNPLSSIAGLEANEGLGDDDRVILLRTQIGQAQLTAGAPLFARRANLIPGPGLTALHDVASGQVVDTATGRFDFVDPSAASNEANWSIEYDVGQDRFYLRSHSYFDPRAGYLTWEDQNNNLEFGGLPSLDPEWRFEQVSSGRYRIRNTRLSGSSPYLQSCFGGIEINNDSPSCVTATFYIDAVFIQNAIDRAVANYYDPKFARPDNGFTRIQHTETRQFLRLSAGSPSVAQVAESDLSAQWKLIPVAFDATYLFALQSRQSSNLYLYRDPGGALRAGALPGTAPSGPLWATDEANQPYLFDLQGTTGHFVRPVQAFDSALRFSSNQLSFAGIGTGSVWRFDGGVRVPAPPMSASIPIPSGVGFVELKQESPPLYAARFTLSYYAPSGGTMRLQRREFTGAGVHIIPSDAQRIRIKAECVGCGFLGDTTIFERNYDRPPNRCFETRGPFFDPHYGKCDPAQGAIATFAKNAAEQVSCEIRALVNFLPSAVDQLGLEEVSRDLLNGRVQRAQRTLFSAGDLRGPDFSGCAPYQSMSFGAGASVGAFNFDAGGEIGLVWGLSQATAGVESYSSVAVSDSGSIFRIASIGAAVSLGVWKDAPRDTAGRSVGIPLQGTREVEVVVGKLKKVRKVPITAGITLWFACDSGSGQIVSSEGCNLRADSRFEGFSIEVGSEAELALPIPDSSSLPTIYQNTCVPALLDGSDC